MQTHPFFRLVFAVFVNGLLATQPGRAAAPANDNFADRIPLAGNRVTVTGSNAGATVEAGEPVEGSFNNPAKHKTIWWTWTAPADGGLAVAASTDAFFAAVDVFQGSSVSNLTRVSRVPGGPAGRPPNSAEMRVIGGDVYHITVGGWEDSDGTVVLNLAFVPRAGNDDFAQRIPLGGGNVRANGSSLGATVEPGEPFQLDRTANGTLWWSWTASESGPFVFQAANLPSAPEDEVLGSPHRFASMSIFVGNQLDTLALVTNRVVDGFVAPPLCQIHLEVVAGTTYQVSVGGEGQLGHFELAIARTTPPGVIARRPLNGSEFLAGMPVPVSAEAFDLESGVASVEFFAFGSFYETHRGYAFSTRPFRAALTNLPPADYYLVARATDAAGIKGDSFPIDFKVRPVNDAFAHRLAIAGSFLTATGRLDNATVETNEPPGLGLANIWWSWTAPASASYTLSASARIGSVELAVFTGTELGNLSSVPLDTVSTPDRVVIHAQTGVSYAIAMHTSFSSGACSLNIAQTTPPSVSLVTPANQMSISEVMPLSLEALASDPDGSISRVEFVSSPGRMLGVVSNAPYILPLTFSPGTYFIKAIAIDNHEVRTLSGEARLEVTPRRPPNDNFADRIPFTGLFITVTGNTANATFEQDETVRTSDGSVWWEWTAPESGDYSITVTSSTGYWPALAIYTGTAMGSLALITNGTFYGRDASYSTLVTIHAAAGEHYHIAAGSREVVSVNVARTLPPTVRFIHPLNNAVFLVGETVEVLAEASDPDGSISRVEFYRDGGALYATLTNEPYVVSLPLTYPSYHRFQARAFDNHGVAASSDEIIFLAREPGPPNDAFADRIPFTGSFVSITGLMAHATWDFGEPFWSRGNPAWWEWTAPASGTFTINLQSENTWPSLAVFKGTELWELETIAYVDRSLLPGNYAQAVIEAEAGVSYPIAVSGGPQVVLTVTRTAPPEVAIIQPAPEAAFITGQIFELQASASDPDGHVRSVEFMLHGLSLGVVTNEPFILPVVFGERGWYSLRARVTDDQGVSAFSDEVSFIIKDSPPINDSFASRTPLHGWYVTQTGTDVESTREPGEPTPAESRGSVWWSWTAPYSGRVTVQSDAMPAYLAVCLGTNVSNLDVVSSVQPETMAPQLEFDAVAGTEYSIVIQSLAGSGWEFRLWLMLDAREISGLHALAPDRFALDLRTTFDRHWNVEATTNFWDWVPLPSTPSANGRIEFSDPAALHHPRRFYRATTE